MTGRADRQAIMAALAGGRPTGRGPCLADEPADRDDGFGKVEQRLNDVLVVTGSHVGNHQLL
jgi:hypothetical protein